MWKPAEVKKVKEGICSQCWAWSTNHNHTKEERLKDYEVMGYYKEPLIMTNKGILHLRHLDSQVNYDGTAGCYKVCAICGIAHHPRYREGAELDYKGYRDLWICKPCIQKLINA